MVDKFNNVKQILQGFKQPPIFEINPGSLQMELERASIKKKLKAIEDAKKTAMINRIENATAKGLLPEGAEEFLRKEFRKQFSSIDDIIKKAPQEAKRLTSGYREMLRRTTPIQTAKQLDINKIASLIENAPQGVNKNMIVKNTADKVIPDVIKSTARVAPRTAGAIGYIPYVGDVADIGLGAYNMFTGHPLIGAGQLGIGALGLASGGMGSKFVKGLAKAGLNQAQRKPIEQLLRRVAKNPYKTRTLPSIALQSFVGDNSEQPIAITDEQINSSVPPKFSLLSNEELGVDANKLPPISSIAGINSVDGVSAPQVSSQLQSTTQFQQPQNVVDNSAIARALIEMYGRQYNEMQKPQVEALQTYKRKLPWANISDALIKGGLASYAQAYDIPGLANVYTGSEYTNRLAKNYDVDQALANIPMNRFNAINTLAGNVAVANQMGLDPAVAMADKDIQKVLTAYNTMGSRENVANINAMARMYGADKTYEAKMYDTMIDNETARAIAQGKYDTAIQLQQLKNIGGARNALINASGFGATPADIQAVLSRFGYGPVGLNQQGTLAGQQTQAPGSFLDELR